ncbi:MAG TPA: hypothetical protein VGB17_09485 [Pyrinomonadaceae bacterium]|jgi:hypothetical protein
MKKRQEKKLVTKLPSVISHVRDLEVVSATVVGEDTPEATAVVKIRNNSDLGVTAVEISTKNDIDSGAVNIDGLDDPDNPNVIIRSHETITLKMGLNEMVPDVPLIVSGATYVDGTEDGDAWSINAMRKVRERRHAERKAQKGAMMP